MLDKGTIIECKIPSNIPGLQVKADKALELALSNNPTILDQNQQLLEQDEAVAKAKAASGLNTTLYASYGLNQSAQDFDLVYKDPGQSQRLRRELDDRVLCTRETQELRLQTEQMGRSLLEWLKSVRPDTPPAPPAWGTSVTPWSMPSPPAALGRRQHARRLPGLCLWLAENMVQAAIKAVPLGQSAGQRMLARLAQETPVAVDAALALADDERQSFSPMLAVLSARHEHQYSRLFRSSMLWMRNPPPVRSGYGKWNVMSHPIPLR